MEIREKIFYFLQNENIKREDFAKKAKISVSTLSNYINGKREIPISFLMWLLKEYKIIDVRKLFDINETDIRHSVNQIVAEDRAEYGIKKDLLIKEVSKLLDEFFISDTNSTQGKIK